MGDFRAQIAAVKTGERRFLRNDAQVRPRRRARRHRGDHGPERGGGARARRARCPTASMRPNRSWTTTASTSASACRSRCKVVVKGDQMTVDLTDVSKQVAGLLQFRQDRGPFLLPGGVQVPDLGARPADQRRPVPRARHRAAARPRGQRGEARGDADVDDLSDDHRRHDLQGAGAGDARPGDRRPSRRSRASAASTAGGRRTTASTSISAG